MRDVYYEMFLHVIISTKGLTPWITQEVAEHLYPALGRMVRAQKCILHEIGGTEDHIHMFLEWHPEISITNVLEAIKTPSTNWIHETFPALSEFAWQEGYCAFSMDKSEEEAIRKYIAGQAEHHEVEDFHSELVRILRANGLEFDEKTVHD